MVYLGIEDIKDMVKGDFTDLKIFHQSAPQDFVRSAGWRKQDGKATLFDRWILYLGMSFSAEAFNKIVAKFGKTCRVSFSCIKK